MNRVKISLLCCAFSSLFGCASSGLYQKSDQWCAEHPKATEYQCPGQALSRATTYCQYGEHANDPACAPAAAPVAPAPEICAHPEQFPRYHKCPRAAYQYLDAEIFACSHLQNKPPVIVLDAENYKRFVGELERCIGHKLCPGTQPTLCKIPVVPQGGVPRGKEVGT